MKILECLACLLFVLGSAEAAFAQEESPGEWVARQRTLLHPQPVRPDLPKAPTEVVTQAWLDKARWKLTAKLTDLLDKEAQRYRAARAVIVEQDKGRRYLGAGFLLTLDPRGSRSLDVRLENQHTHAGLSLFGLIHDRGSRVEIGVSEQHLGFEVELKRDEALVEVRFMPPYELEYGRNGLKALADLLGVEPSPAELDEPHGDYRRLVKRAAKAFDAGGDLELDRTGFRYGLGYRLRLRLQLAEARPAPPQAFAAYLEAEQAYMARVAELARPALALAIESLLLEPGSPPFQLGVSHSQRNLYTPETGWTARVTTDGCGGNVFVYEPADGTPRVVVHQTGTELSAIERQSLDEDAAMRAVIVANSQPAPTRGTGLVGLGR